MERNMIEKKKWILPVAQLATEFCFVKIPGTSWISSATELPEGKILNIMLLKLESFIG